MYPHWHRLTIEGDERPPLNETIPGVVHVEGNEWAVPVNALSATIEWLKAQGYRGRHGPDRTRFCWHAYSGPTWPFEGKDIPYQDRAADRAANRGYLYLKSPPGSGKTEAALRAMTRAGCTVGVIIVPSNAVIQWSRRIKDRLGIESYIYTPPSRRRKSWVAPADWCKLHATQPRFLVISHENLGAVLDNHKELARLFLKGGTYAALVIDEIHEFIDNSLWERDEFGNYKRVESRCSDLDLISRFRADVLRIGLSGTPIGDRPRNLAFQLQVLQPDQWGKGKWGFANRYCGVSKKDVGTRVVLDDSGMSNPVELRSRMAEVLMEVPDSEVAPYLPKLTIDLQYCPPEAQLKNISFGKDFTREGSRLAKVGGEGHLQWRLAKAAGNVWPETKNLLESRLGRGKKMLIFGEHRAVVRNYHDRIQKLLADKVIPAETQVWVVDGDTPDTERQAAVDTYMSCRTPAVLVATSATLGTAVDLQDTDTVIVAQLPVVPSTLLQQIKRAHRIGGSKHVEAFLMVAEGTAAERVVELLREKIPMITRLFSDGNMEQLEAALKLPEAKVAGYIAELSNYITSMESYDADE
jgi:superfamily II DNA or RNA helicase